jgi:hypothetical protein
MAKDGKPEFKSLTERERRLVLVVLADPDVTMWRAGQLSGFCGADPDGPEPDTTTDEGRARHRSLHNSAKRALARPHVSAELTRKRASLALAAARRDGQGVEASEALAKRDRRDRIVAEQAAIDHGALLLDVKLRAAQADIGEFCHWSGGVLTVKDSDALTPAQRQLIAEIKFSPICGKCGAAHDVPGVSLKLVDKVRMAALASKQLGVDAPKQVELSGRNGAPIQAEVGIKWPTIEGVRWAITGRPVGALASG